MCELVASQQGVANCEKFYTVGLFSVLDGMLGIPMEKVVVELPLADDIGLALSEFEGALGGALKAVIAYERGDWRNAHWMGIARENLSECYYSAVAWVEEKQKNIVALL